MSNKIGKKIRQLRVISGLSQDNVADEIGMSHGNYGKIERGEIDIDSTRLITLAKVLKVSVGDFFHNNITLVKEAEPPYGYATKTEVSEIANTINELAKTIVTLSKEIEGLRKKNNSKKTKPKK